MVSPSTLTVIRNGAPSPASPESVATTVGTGTPSSAAAVMSAPSAAIPPWVRMPPGRSRWRIRSRPDHAPPPARNDHVSRDAPPESRCRSSTGPPRSAANPSARSATSVTSLMRVVPMSPGRSSVPLVARAIMASIDITPIALVADVADDRLQDVLEGHQTQQFGSIDHDGHVTSGPTHPRQHVGEPIAGPDAECDPDQTRWQQARPGVVGEPQQVLGVQEADHIVGVGADDQHPGVPGGVHQLLGLGDGGRRRYRHQLSSRRHHIGHAYAEEPERPGQELVLTGVDLAHGARSSTIAASSAEVWAETNSSVGSTPTARVPQRARP